MAATAAEARIRDYGPELKQVGRHWGEGIDPEMMDDAVGKLGLEEVQDITDSDSEGAHL